MRRLFIPESLFFVIMLAMTLILFRERAFLDPGAFWHIRVGEIILNDGFPWTDPFTYTHSGKTWIPQQWLGEVAMALAHRISQFDTLLLGFSALLSTLYTWLFHRMRISGLGWPLAAAFVWIAFFVGSYHYYVRPHMISIVFLAWMTAHIVDFDRKRITVTRLLILIPLFIVWVNIHAGVLAGILTLAMAVCGWIALWKFGRYGPIGSNRQAASLVMILILCVVTPLINPFGMEMIRTWWRIMGSEVVPKIILEHMPLNPSNTAGQVVIGLGIIYTMVFLGTFVQGYNNIRLTWLIPFVWFVLSIMGIRQGPLFAVVSAVMIADIWPHTLYYRYLASHGDMLATQTKVESQSITLPCYAWVIPLLVVIGPVYLQMAKLPIPIIGHKWAIISKTTVPVDLCDVVQKSICSLGPNRHIYNDANLGGYMLYYHPGELIFMDDRCELYNDDWLQSYYDITVKNPARFEVWADRYNIDFVLVESNPDKPLGLESYLSTAPNWHEVQGGRGARAVLFERRKTPIMQTNQ
ncbi:MAG: hypothetical protein LC104_17150 [Bacteroidales bacterium]|nr:hypothetical protein [Bacteroidales bacterium]